MIELLNVKAGDIFYHSIIQIFGNCTTTNADESIEVSDGNGRIISWKIVNSFFKAFVELNHGKNQINIRSSTCQVKLIVYRLSHAIIKSFRVDSLEKRSLRVLYVVCKDDPLNGEFESDSLNGNNKLENALKRVDLGVKLLQTFISEVLYKNFRMRKTFMLRNDIEELDEENACEVFYTSLSKQKALEMKENQLFIYLAEEIKAKKIYESNSKFIAVLSFTQYKHSEETDIFKNAKGYCALGAEWLAVYGTPCLYSWAEGLETLEKCFTNNTLIDTSRLMNDSAYRNVYWACYSTTLGSLLHEFSHILDIGHNLTGIMARGFDDLYRFFTVNSGKCICYSKHSNVKTNNLFIDRITTVSNEIENKEARLKQTRVKKIAFFKNDFIDKLSFISGFKNEIIFSLTCDQNIGSSTSFDKYLLDSSHNCKCMMKCSYHESNLFMLFYNKWLNNSFMKNSESACSNLFKIDRSKINKALKIVLTSQNELASYEMRTLRRSLTFKHRILVDLYVNTLEIDCTSLNTELQTFLLEVPKGQQHNEEDFIDSFEIVALDVFGNVFKKIVNC